MSPGGARHQPRALGRPSLARGGTNRHRSAGDVLDSWRSSWRLYRKRVAHDVAMGANGIASAPQDHRQV